MNTNGSTCSTSSPTSTTTVYTYDWYGLRTSATHRIDYNQLHLGDQTASSSRLVSHTACGTSSTRLARQLRWSRSLSSGSSPTTNLLLSDESGNTRGLVQLSSRDALRPAGQLHRLRRCTALPSLSLAARSRPAGSYHLADQHQLELRWLDTLGIRGGLPDRQDSIYLTAATMTRLLDILSVDPLVSQTMEPYEYAGENPMAHTDPSGQSAYGCIGLDPQNGFTLCFGIDGSGQTVLQMSVYVFDRKPALFRVLSTSLQPWPLPVLGTKYSP